MSDLLVHVRLTWGLVLGMALTSCGLGCGAGAIGAQADLIAAAGIVTAQADVAIVEARERDLTADLDHAREVCGADGCTPDEAASVRASRDAVKARWASVLECRGLVFDALGAWLGALDLAHAASGDVGMGLLVSYALRYLAMWAHLDACLGAAAPGVDLPDLPADVAAIGGAS